MLTKFADSVFYRTPYLLHLSAFWLLILSFITVNAFYSAVALLCELSYYLFLRLEQLDRASAPRPIPAATSSRYAGETSVVDR